MQQLEQDIRQFIIDNFLFGKDDIQLSYDDSFIEHGIMDSTSALELIALLEGKYGIKIDDEELDPENFDSINKLVRFINRKTRPMAVGADGE
jgi:acyl carrier protein